MAYRFYTDKGGKLTIENEIADFSFSANHKLFIPYVRDFRSDEKWMQSFEATYDEHTLSETKEGTNGFFADYGGTRRGQKGSSYRSRFAGDVLTKE